MDWTEAEIKLIIEDHFSMLQKQLRNIPYSKTEHRRALQMKIRRSEAAIEFKHRNISAILELLGFEILSGYAPARNYQKLLASTLEQIIATSKFDAGFVSEPVDGLDEPAQLFAEGPPERLLIPVDEPEYIRRLARKFDPVLRDMQNKQLGMAGEKLIFDREIDLLRRNSRFDLAKKVQWTAQELGEGAGYDIKSFSADGREKFIEVKTTNGSKGTPFYLTNNELEFSREAGSSYNLSRLYEFRKGAKLYELSAPLDDFVFLSPVVYRAGFER